MDLLVRVGRQDHLVVEQLLAPEGAGLSRVGPPPVGAVVADAQVARERVKALTRITAAAGATYLIDPLTPLLQSEQPVTDSWARLPFATPAALTPADLRRPGAIDGLVEETINFQREHGATHLIPPYLYTERPEDAWAEANLELLARTAEFLRVHDVGLPVIPVLALGLPGYGPQRSWRAGLDRQLAATRALQTEAVALSFSWSDPARSTLASLSYLLTATKHAADQYPVIGWRSGLYGLAQCAAGATGYETGMGSRESLNYRQFAASHRPQDRHGTPTQQAYTYFTQFGRSVQRKTGQALLANTFLQGSLVCDPLSSCCPEGIDSMLGAWRPHAVRQRARELRELDAMPPQAAWRLNRVSGMADRARLLAATANEVLTATGSPTQLPAATFEHLQQVTAQLRDQTNRRAA